ncbi:hypothetical protein HDE78_000243 [Rhodanobacter sp. K2T2]|uniref:hypothetical protein n=1 Tax=Rhodanobacter sp. K2T2 TaxID=2723085 RepID=UPI0015CA16CD|nr:hypothetical protein [Rhodanobacter sp. K2T2]NYE27318.1 hypothetical protein [Rhodanobacter sp. K2T2]
MSELGEIETAKKEFCEVSRVDKNLLMVNEGLPGIYALQQAICLLEAIKDIAHEGVQQEMSCSTAWLVGFATDTAQALLHSIEPGVEHGIRSALAADKPFTSKVAGASP